MTWITFKLFSQLSVFMLMKELIPKKFVSSLHKPQ